MLLKLIIRSLLKRFVFTFIKVIGLSLAFSISLAVSLFIIHELNYDHFFSNAERIYRFTVFDQNQLDTHSSKLMDASYVSQMADYFNEIENHVRLASVLGGVIRYDDEFIRINQAFISDSSFFEIFDQELIVGNKSNVLRRPCSVVVSESFARKIFGERDPLGNILTLPQGQYYFESRDFIVTGIMKDFPSNSHMHPEFVISASDEYDLARFTWVYFLLRENADKENLASGFGGFYASMVSGQDNAASVQAHLQNIGDIHLNSNKLREIEINGNLTTIYALMTAAIILLLVAYINYANLNTGMATFHQKFNFISKVNGATDWVIFRSILLENLIIACVATLLSLAFLLVIDILIRQYFNIEIISDHLPIAAMLMICFVLFGLIAGTVPQSYMVLKRILGTRKGLVVQGSIFKNKSNGVLLVIQYSISFILIVVVFVIFRQTNFAMEKSIGGRSSIICIENVHSEVQTNFTTFKNELLKYTSVASVSAMLTTPGGETNDRFGFTLEGHEATGDLLSSSNSINVLPSDYSIAEVFNLSFLGGENFSKSFDDSFGFGEYIINETAMKSFGYQNAEDIIGKEFQVDTNMDHLVIPKGRIVGVVEDFHLSSLKSKIEPLVLFKRKDLWLLNFVVSFHEGQEKEGLAATEMAWSEVFPEHQFTFSFIEEIYKKIYTAELLQARLLSVFTIVSLFVCAMGLLGMVLLTVNKRTKEIGIRKVNGANVYQIMKLLYWDFLKWIVLSIVIAMPAAYFLSKKWLGNFEYRIELSWWIFIIAGLAVLMVVTATTFSQTNKAANQNPINTLKYE